MQKLKDGREIKNIKYVGEKRVCLSNGGGSGIINLVTFDQWNCRAGSWEKSNMGKGEFEKALIKEEEISITKNKEEIKKLIIHLENFNTGMDEKEIKDNKILYDSIFDLVDLLEIYNN